MVPRNNANAKSENFDKILGLRRRIALMEENQQLRGPMARRLTVEEKVSHRCSIHYAVVRHTTLLH